MSARRLLDFAARLLRALRLLARDPRVPRPLRWAAALGLLPIPGPFDEALLVALAPLFALLCRRPMREAWQQAGPSRPDGGG